MLEWRGRLREPTATQPWEASDGWVTNRIRSHVVAQCIGGLRQAYHRGKDRNSIQDRAQDGAHMGPPPGTPRGAPRGGQNRPGKKREKNPGFSAPGAPRGAPPGGPKKGPPGGPKMGQNDEYF
jgi:hypothetical protein